MWHRNVGSYGYLKYDYNLPSLSRYSTSVSQDVWYSKQPISWKSATCVRVCSLIVSRVVFRNCRFLYIFSFSGDRQYRRLPKYAIRGVIIDVA